MVINEPASCVLGTLNRSVTRESSCLLTLARILLTDREMRFLLCTLLALLLPVSAESQVQREIHFHYRVGLIWLKVDVSGKSEPLNFLLDSGAGISAIDTQTARSLGVHLGNRQIVRGEDGKASLIA